MVFTDPRNPAERMYDDAMTLATDTSVEDTARMLAIIAAVLLTPYTPDPRGFNRMTKRPS